MCSPSGAFDILLSLTTFIFDENNNVTDSSFEILKDNPNKPLLPSSERNFSELLELIVPCKADLLLSPNILSKKDINLTL